MNTILFKSNEELLEAIREKRFLSRIPEDNIIINAKSDAVYYDVFRRVASPFSMMYTYQGKEYYEIDGLTLHTAPSHVIIIPPGKPYSSFIDKNSHAHCLSFYFSETLVHDLFTPSIFSEANYQPNLIDILDQKKVLPVNNISQNLLNSFIKLKELESDPDHLLLIMSNLVLETFERYKQVWNRILTYDAQKHTTRVEVGKRLYRVKDFLYCNYDQDIDVEQLSKIAFLNQYYLIRKFKSFFGVTPYQMLLDRRMEVAKEQIIGTDNPITSIVKDVGFNSLPNFYTAFKNKYHTTPTDLRN